MVEGLPKLRQVYLDGNLIEVLRARAIANNPMLQLVSIQVTLPRQKWDAFKSWTVGALT